MRRLIPFACAGDMLLGTLDEAPGATGLIVVSGGNELRAGAHRGMAALAARVADRGVPVFRYDRRGVGDSEGVNSGFAGARDDLVAAADTFRREVPGLDRLIGFGNCDGAATLALFGRGAGIDAVVLANPWLHEETDGLPSVAAIRSRYTARLRDPRTWRDLLSGGLNVPRAIRGLRKLLGPAPEQDDAVLRAILPWRDDSLVLLAAGDATARTYAEAARRAGIDLDTVTVDTASHSFARPADQEAVFAAVMAACR